MTSAKRNERRGGRNSRMRRTKNEKNGEKEQKAVKELAGPRGEGEQVVLWIFQLREKEIEVKKEREKGVEKEKRGGMPPGGTEMVTPKLQGAADPL